MPENTTKFAAIFALILAALGLGRKATTVQDALPSPPIPRKPTNFLSDVLTSNPTWNLDDLYRKHGTRQNLDWKLLKAIAQVESSENPSAKNPADPSYGLMQILCRSSGPTSPCTNKLNVNGWPATPETLYDPDFNLYIGSQILRWNIDTYRLLKGIAVYNNWGARLDPEEGPYRNQGYVDKVMGAYNAIRAAH